MEIELNTENTDSNTVFRLCDYSPLVLAYMGDAVITLLAREKLIGSGNVKVAELNKLEKLYVTAKSQSASAERIIPLLDATELSVYKSGRNAKSAHTPRSAEICEYRRATGLEALFGYLYLSGQSQRARYLFGVCYGSEV